MLRHFLSLGIFKEKKNHIIGGSQIMSKKAHLEGNWESREERSFAVLWRFHNNNVDGVDWNIPALK